jgi:hypothetical protein
LILKNHRFPVESVEFPQQIQEFHRTLDHALAPEMLQVVLNDLAEERAPVVAVGCTHGKHRRPIVGVGGGYTRDDPYIWLPRKVSEEIEG